MPRLFQQLLSPLDPRGGGAAAPLLPQVDDDVALGWECANPALQFESWEPAPAAPQGSAGPC